MKSRADNQERLLAGDTSGAKQWFIKTQGSCGQKELRRGWGACYVYCGVGHTRRREVSKELSCAKEDL